jgi:hypothetical protein
MNEEGFILLFYNRNDPDWELLIFFDAQSEAKSEAISEWWLVHSGICKRYQQ